MNGIAASAGRTISVFLADDNLIVREECARSSTAAPTSSVVGVAADYDEVVDGLRRR